MKLRPATESVGWLNSVGPLDVSPTAAHPGEEPADHESTAHETATAAEVAAGAEATRPKNPSTRQAGEALAAVGTPQNVVKVVATEMRDTADYEPRFYYLKRDDLRNWAGRLEASAVSLPALQSEQSFREMMGRCLCGMPATKSRPVFQGMTLAVCEKHASCELDAEAALPALQAERDAYQRGCEEWNEKFEVWRSECAQRADKAEADLAALRAALQTVHDDLWSAYATGDLDLVRDELKSLDTLLAVPPASTEQP